MSKTELGGSGTKKDQNSETKEKSSETTKDQSSETDGSEKKDAEIGETASALTRRFFKWTKEDLFDWNPGYAKTIRGILNMVHIVLSMLVMALVGSACQYPYSSGVTLFYCHSSAAFMFVIACSACIHSTLLLLCCILSKKGDRIIHMTPLEMLYYVVYCLFFCIGGLALETNLNAKNDGYHVTMAGGVFGITNSILFLIAAIWFVIYHKTKKNDDRRRPSSSRSRNRSRNRSRRSIHGSDSE